MRLRVSGRVDAESACVLDQHVESANEFLPWKHVYPRVEGNAAHIPLFERQLVIVDVEDSRALLFKPRQFLINSIVPN